MLLLGFDQYDRTCLASFPSTSRKDLLFARLILLNYFHGSRDYGGSLRNNEDSCNLSLTFAMNNGVKLDKIARVILTSFLLPLLTASSLAFV